MGICIWGIRSLRLRQSMQRRKKWAAVLLAGVMILTAGGCRQKKFYTAGLQTELLAGSEDLQAGNPAVTRKEPESRAQKETVPEDPAVICVFVCGAVQSPGVYELETGARVYEAILHAGGFREDADTQWLNQAEPVLDGQKLYVFTKEETAKLVWHGDSAAGTGQTDRSLTDGKINLNTADRDALMTLPGIGESKADAILQYREDHGGFSSLEEIQEIPGIKSAVFSKIKDQITI